MSKKITIFTSKPHRANQTVATIIGDISFDSNLKAIIDFDDYETLKAKDPSIFTDETVEDMSNMTSEDYKAKYEKLLEEKGSSDNEIKLNKELDAAKKEIEDLKEQVQVLAAMNEELKGGKEEKPEAEKEDEKPSVDLSRLNKADLQDIARATGVKKQAWEKLNKEDLIKFIKAHSK